MIEKAREHINAREWDAAEPILRGMVEEDPGDAEAMFYLAQVRREQGELDEAQELMEQVERLEPFNPNVFHAAGALGLARGDAAAAERSFRQALDIDPNHLPSRNGMAFIELAAGRFEAAEHSADLVLAEEPDNAQALTYKGTALLEQGAHREATVYLQEALKLDPAALTAQLQLGRAFLAGDNAAFALRCFENALQAAPGSSELLEYKGRAQLAAGHMQDALTTLRSSVEAGRANPDLYRDLAACELAAGNPGRAEGLLGAALQMAAGRADLVLPRAELLLARGAAEEALGLLGSVENAGDAAGPLAELRTRALLAAGREADALTEIRALVDGGDASVEARLLLAEALLAGGENEKAEGVLEELRALDPAPLAVRMFEARRRFDAGDDSAIDLFRELLADGGLNAQQRTKASRMLADALHRAERYAEAAKAYDAAAHRRAEVLYIDHELQSERLEPPESAMDAEVVKAWPSEPPPDGRREPVLAIGWPGCGQERVLPALGAHPELALVLDPSPSQARRRAHIDRPRGAGALAKLDDAQVQLRRGRYWKALDALELDTSTPLVLDGMWLTAESLPTIYRLFPGARVLFIHRDPRDLTIGWMRGGYRDLETMAQAYRRQLQLLERCRETLPLEIVDVDYDELERNPEQGLRKLLERLGLTWDEGVLETYRATLMPVDVEAGAWRAYAGSGKSSSGAEEPGASTVH